MHGQKEQYWECFRRTALSLAETFSRIALAWERFNKLPTHTHISGKPLLLSTQSFQYSIPHLSETLICWPLSPLTFNYQDIYDIYSPLKHWGEIKYDNIIASTSSIKVVQQKSLVA